MGAADGGNDERPVHRVHLSEFFIGRFAVTCDEYARFVRDAGHRAPAVRALPVVAAGGRDAVFKDLARPYAWDRGQPPAGRGSHPVVLVTYDDAVAYCAWLSACLDKAVRLPTEAEWEKAARGGAEGQPYPSGSSLNASLANFLVDPSTKSERGTRATGTYPPNGYGLYDMSGNVWEWVSDWYAADYYSTAEARDPVGPPTGSLRIVRGGSWVNEDVSMLRCAYRHPVPPDTYAHSIGFRIVCT